MPAGCSNIDHSSFYFSVKESFNKLSAAVKAKLTDASKFATATVQELKSVSQDVLSSLVSVYFVVVVLQVIQPLTMSHNFPLYSSLPPVSVYGS